MYYLHHVHAASASVQSLYLPNFIPATPCLCVVRHASLSFIALQGSEATPQGHDGSPEAAAESSAGKALSELFSVPINGRILQVARLANAAADQLMVLTDHHQPRLIVLSYSGRPNYSLPDGDGQAGSLNWSYVRTDAVAILEELGRPAAEGGLTLEVEDGVGAEFAVCHTHVGVVKVVRTQASQTGKANESRDRTPDLTHLFSARTPHPHIISSKFLQRRSGASPPTLALLSLSSFPSRLPGLGMQTLPVLSFHTIDESNKQLRPLPWGPPRRAPTITSPKSPSCESAAPARNMPGSFVEPNLKTKNATASTSSGRHGPAASGATLTAEQRADRESTLAKSPLSRAHVPLPFMDALGAHLLLPLPARAGGGVIVFCESSILVVPPPSVESEQNEKAPGRTGGLTGKRRKSSTGDSTASTSRQTRRASNAQAANGGSALATSPPSSTTLIAANENGKRRRSTASSSSQAPPLSTVSTERRRSSAAAQDDARILRMDAQPMIVASACVVKEPGTEEDDGVRSLECTANVKVLFATSAGLLQLLIIELTRAVSNRTDIDISEPLWTPSSLSVASLGPIPSPGGPEALTYLGENFIHVASTGGDSVVLRVDGEHLSEIHRWPNLAPILDFVVDDGSGGDPADARSAQARIVTCSGSGPSGSLRIVRNGVALEDLASITESGIRRVWQISRGEHDEPQSKLLILAHAKGTRIVALGSTSGSYDLTERFGSTGWDDGEVTIDAAQIGLEGAFVTASASGVTLFHPKTKDGAQKVSRWLPSDLTQMPSLAAEKVTRAALNEAGQALLAFRTGHVVLLQVDPLDGVSFVRLHQFDSEVSALDISILGNATSATLAAVALWKPSVVKLLTLPDMRDATPSSLMASHPSLVRSVRLHTFAAKGAVLSAPHLLVGLGDGTLHSLSLSLPNANSLSQTIGVLERRTASMGTQPVHLRAFVTSMGLKAIFASSDRSTVVFSRGSGLNYSAVRHQNVLDVCELDIAASAQEEQDDANRLLVIVQPDELRIARMGEISKLDISTIELGADNPLAIALHTEQKAVGVVTTRFLHEGRTLTPSVGGKVMLRDIAGLQSLDTYDLDPDERPNCIDAFKHADAGYLVVGTGYAFPDRSETTSGRVLLFDISAGRLRLVYSHKVNGNVFDVKAVGTRYIVACVNSKVLSFEIESDVEMTDQTSPSLERQTISLEAVGEWACAFTAITITVSGPDKLVVGDALRSIVVLQLQEESGKLVELARDCDPYWTVACEALDDDEGIYVGSDIAFNLWTTRRVKWTQAAKSQMMRLREQEERRSAQSDRVDVPDDTFSHVMQRDGAYHYGDLINKMKRGALVAQSGSSVGGNASGGQRKPIESKILFATAAGALGILAVLDERAGRLLTQLEVKLNDAWQSVGQITPEEYRTLRTDHRVQAAAGFIDGDLLRHRYDNLSNEQRARILRRGRLPLDADVDEVNGLVESLARLS